MTTLTVTSVVKSFGSVPVLQDVSLSVPAGTRTAVVGGSGSGKSTLLRLVAGFEQVDGGTVSLGPRTVAGPGVSVPAHRRGIGYVPQDGGLFPHLTVDRNIRFGLPRGAERAARVAEVMELVSLAAELSGRYPHELSGGQQQRVSLARALAPAPHVILLDEPFSALDTGLREQTRAAVVAALGHSEVTTVLVTHDQDEALSFGHQIGIIDDGRMVQAGDPAQVFDDPATAQLADFLGPCVTLPAAAERGHAVCALGRIPIRHDRSGGLSEGLAMIRPAQVTLGRSAGSADGVVDGLTWRGSCVDVHVRAGSGGSVGLAIRVPAHDAGGYGVGAPVSVLVSGGCVFYPAR